MSSPSKSPSMELVQQNHPHAKDSVTASSSSPSPIKQLQHIPNEAISQASVIGKHDANVLSSNSNIAAETDQFLDEEEELNNFINNQNRQQDAFLNSFPPGFRFKPHDDELVLYYLQKMIMNEPLPPNKIMAVNLYRHNPETLAERYETYGEKEWYFFTPRDRKYRNGYRPNRAAGEGYWKATGADKMIKSGNVVVGCKRALVFYRGKPPKGKKTNWIMHEYRVPDYPDSLPPKRTVNDMRLDNWVLCRMYKKADNKNKNVTLNHREEPAEEGTEESFSTSQPADNMETEINGQVDNSEAMMDQSEMENPYSNIVPPYPSSMLHQHQIQLAVDLGQMQQQACDTASSLMQFHHGGEQDFEHKCVVQSQDQKRTVQPVDVISESMAHTYKLCSDKRYGMQFSNQKHIVQRPPTTRAYSDEKCGKKSAEQQIQKPLLFHSDEADSQYIEDSNEESLWKLFHLPDLGAMFYSADI